VTITKTSTTFGELIVIASACDDKQNNNLITNLFEDRVNPASLKIGTRRRLLASRLTVFCGLILVVSTRAVKLIKPQMKSS